MFCLDMFRRNKITLITTVWDIWMKVALMTSQCRSCIAFIITETTTKDRSSMYSFNVGFQVTGSGWKVTTNVTYETCWSMFWFYMGFQVYSSASVITDFTIKQLYLLMFAFYVSKQSVSIFCFEITLFTSMGNSLLVGFHVIRKGRLRQIFFGLLICSFSTCSLSLYLST